MTNFLMGLICMLIWALALYENYTNKRVKLFAPGLYYVGLFCDIYLVVYYAIHMITFSPIPMVLFFLAMVELAILTIKSRM